MLSVYELLCDWLSMTFIGRLYYCDSSIKVVESIPIVQIPKRLRKIIFKYINNVKDRSFYLIDNSEQN